MTKQPTPPMPHAEMVEILKGIARDPKAYPSARVTALRTLQEWRREDEEAGRIPSGFDDLDELAPKRKAKRSR